MLREVQLQAEVTDLDLVLVREGLVCSEEEAAVVDLALKGLKGRDFREVEAKLALEDLVGVEECAIASQLILKSMYLVVKKASAVSTMALPAPAVMKAVPMLMSLLRQAKAEEDHASCQLYHDAAEEEVDVSGVDESTSSGNESSSDYPCSLATWGS